MIDKLQAHYGFTRMPFGRDLAPGMLHRHAAHNEACARITWCIAERAIGVITGEVGAGKTVSVRTVLAGLDASRHTIIYLPNPMIGIRGLHEMIVATFGGQPDRSYSRLTAQAAAMLAAERDERGKTPVLVIDEAHLLRYEQLETIRMLTNHNLDADSPLACLLIGQPTLRRTMKLAVLAALEQRTALRYAMPPMTSQETSSYISHHLKLAGRSDPLFSDDLEHPGFGGDSILPRCSGLGGRCLPRYRRLAEPRSDHFAAFVYRISVQLRCPAAPPGGGLRPPGPRPLGLGISSSGTPACAAGSPGWSRVTRSVIARDAGGALDLGGGSVAPVPRPARRCPPAAAPVLTCRAISEEGRGPGRSPGGCGRSPPG